MAPHIHEKIDFTTSVYIVFEGGEIRWFSKEELERNDEVITPNVHTRTRSSR